MKFRWLFLIGLSFLFGCKSSSPKEPSAKKVSIAGRTMGTEYSIIYLDPSGTNYKTSIDSILVSINLDVSTYMPASVISQFNRLDKLDPLVEEGKLSILKSEHPHFITVFEKAKEIHKASGGAFNPALMVLINSWGFGYTSRQPKTDLTEAHVVELLELCKFDEVKYSAVKVETDEMSTKDVEVRYLFEKKNPLTQLDFNAIAKGYGVDMCGELLEHLGIDNYFIEIGGEVRARGKGPRNSGWNTGITYPDEKASKEDITSVIQLNNLSLATSGNYRNFRELEGLKFGHTINPFTGFPEKNSLLSVSVFATDCMTADAYATACMVLGKEKALELIESQSELEALFVYGDESGGMKIEYTDALKDMILN